MNRSVFFIYSALVTLLPAVALIPIFGSSTGMLFLGGDAYLYLGIAESSTPDFFSFDGEKPTNGFHPLWQAYVWFLAQLVPDPIVLMNLTAWSAIFLCLIGVWLLGMATARTTNSWLLAGLVTPGVYFLLIGQGLSNLSVWDFYSGMEAGLALALTGLVAYVVVRFRPDEPRLSMWLGLGIILGFLMLTRLDDVFVGPAIALCWLFWSPGKFWRRVPAVVGLGLPPALMLALYWYYNLTHVGVLMPVSGAAKGEGALVANGWVTAATFLAPLIDLRAALTDYTPGHAAIAGAAFRVAQVVFPGLMGVVFLGLIWRYFRTEAWAPLVAGMCAAVTIKAGYNFVAVNYWHQASWYFSFAFGTISFATALILAPVLAKLRAAARFLPGLLACVIAMVAFLQASQAYLAQRTAPGFLGHFSLWEAREDIESELLAARPGAKLIEFGDGILNFALEMPVRHGFVFAGDPESLTALQESRLLSSAFEDGYVLLASFEYLRWPEASTTRSSDEIRAFLTNSVLDDRVEAELDAFDFEIVYVYEPISLPFFALSKRQE